MKERYSMNKNEEKGFAYAYINCEKTIYRKFLKTIENTHFLD